MSEYISRLFFPDYGKIRRHSLNYAEKNHRFAKQNTATVVNIGDEPELDVLGGSANKVIGLIDKKITNNFKQKSYKSQ